TRSKRDWSSDVCSSDLSQNSAARNKQGSAPSEATILVRAPEGVRAAASLLLGLGVAAMVMPLATTWQVMVLIIAIGAGFLVTFRSEERRVGTEGRVWS